jgi:CRP-like cAMP-binding protein
MGSLVETLATTSLMEGLPPKDLARVAGFFRTESFPRGAVLIRKGDPGLDLYIILEGMVEVSYPGPAPGESRVLATLGPGNVIGDISFLDSGPRSADVTCATDAVMAVLRQEDFFGLVGTYPLIGAVIYHNLAVELCDRLRVANDEIHRLNLRNADLLGTLLELGIVAEPDPAEATNTTRPA